MNRLSTFRPTFHFHPAPVVIRRAWVVCLWALCAFSAAELSAQADSLLRQLAATGPDTNRVNLLIETAWEINEVRTDEAVNYLREAIGLSRTLQYPKGEASAWNGLGIAEEIKGNYNTALEHFNKALEIRQQIGDQASVAATYNNIANAYESIGDYEQALKKHRESLFIVEQLGDPARAARAHFNIAGVYEAMGVYPEAYDHVNSARLVLEERNDREGMAKAYSLLGHIRFELEMHDEARGWYLRALRLREDLRDSIGIADAYADLGNALDELGNQRHAPDSIQAGLACYERALAIYRKLDDQDGIAAVFNNFGDACKHLGQYERAMNYLRQALDIRRRLDDQAGLMEVYNTIGDVQYGLKNYDEALVYTEKYAEIALAIKDEKFEQKAYKDFSKLYAMRGDFKKAFEYRVKYDELRYKRLDEQRSEEFSRKEVLFSDQRKQIEIERQQRILAIQDAEIAKFNATRNGLIGGAGVLAMLVGLFYYRALLRERLNKQLAAKNEAIEHERKRADDLLINILPAETAAELKQRNAVRPVRYESVTVMFTDFKSFTKIAEVVPPEDLIDELDECFRLFDAIVERYGLEKIKTLGDSYMCAGGLPTPNQTHPVDMVHAAIDMHRELTALMELKKAEGKPVFEMRIGINTGPVVAGVVGSRKFAYDIWGDTVNMAARLEQGSEVGKINISENTWREVRHIFNCTYRGEVEAKHKGKVAMYFVEF